MEALGTAGGTELLPAATHVLEKIGAHSADRRTSVILITDGQVGNDAEILRAFKPAAPVTVHTFGIDTAVNDAFLKSLARQQRGGCWLQTPDDDIAGTIAALGDRLRRPVLTELSVQGTWETGREALPDLHAREVVRITLRGAAATPLEITGHFPDGTAHLFEVDLGTAGSEAIKLLWAKERITALLAANRRPEAIDLARRHNLICEGAGFIAWDEAEQVPIAEEEIIQPAMAPSHALGLMRHCVDLRTLDCARIEDDGTSFGDFVESRTEEYATIFGVSPNGSVQSADEARREWELRLAQRVRDAGQRCGVAESGVEAWIVWAQSHGEGTAGRLNALSGAAAIISLMQRELDAPVLRGSLGTRHPTGSERSPGIPAQVGGRIPGGLTPGAGPEAEAAHRRSAERVDRSSAGLGMRVRPLRPRSDRENRVLCRDARPSALFRRLRRAPLAGVFGFDCGPGLTGIRHRRQLAARNGHRIRPTCRPRRVLTPSPMNSRPTMSPAYFETHFRTEARHAIGRPSLRSSRPTPPPANSGPPRRTRSRTSNWSQNCARPDGGSPASPATPR